MMNSSKKGSEKYIFSSNDVPEPTDHPLNVKQI